MLFILTAVVIALGWLVCWHLKLIIRGETSIEAHINHTEAKRLKALGGRFHNPYNFGPKKNMRLFFGLVNDRTFWRHFLFPSSHQPIGDGLSFELQSAAISDNSCPL